MLVAGALHLAVVPGVARADDAMPAQVDVAAAESLFAAGRELMDKQEYASACPKFEESNRLDPSAGTLLNLGKCMEALGKTASAWGSYKQAITVGKSKGQQRQIDAANEYILAIEPRLVRLLVDAESAAPGFVVTRTDESGARVELGGAALGVPVAVDPSIYRIQAKAPGFDVWAGMIDVREEGSTVRVKIPELVATRRKVDEPPPPPPRKLDPLLVIGGVTAGVGVVGLALGAAFGVMTIDSANTAIADPKLCPNYRCTPLGQAVISTAESESVVSTVGLVVGGAALVGGVVMITYSVLSHRAPAPHKPSIAVTPLLALGGRSVFGLAIGGEL